MSVLFPNVPNVPGVPAVLRNSSNPGTAEPPRRSSDGLGASILALFLPRWGLFSDTGVPVLVGDSVIAVDYSKDHAISDYPTEAGGFQAYNKVARPYDARVTFAQGGTEADRADFLAQTEAACAALDLLTLVTPEVSYVRANPIRYAYRREARQGVTLLLVDVFVEEVRADAVTTFSNTKLPDGAAEVNGGAVLPVAPTATQGAAIAGKTP